MCAPKVDIPDPEVPVVPEPEEQADTVKRPQNTKSERTRTGASDAGSLQSLRVDLNVPGATSQGQNVGANVPKG